MLTVFKGASSIKIILVLKELTRPTTDSFVYHSKGSLGEIHRQASCLKIFRIHSYSVGNLTAGIHTS